MRITIINDTSSNDLTSEYNSRIDQVIQTVASEPYVDIKLVHALRDAYVTLTYVDPDVIRELNNENRNIDKVTDVLSFPILNMKDGDIEGELDPGDYEKDDEGRDVLKLGDIILCPEVAFRNAE